MALSHVTKVFAVKDAKIAKILTDPSGGTTTLGTSIDVPGIKSVTITGDVNTAELRGDNTRLDYAAVLAGVGVSFEYAKLSLDALNVFIGGAITDAGTTPNQTSTFDLTSANAAMQYFQFTAQVPGTDTITGDAVFTLYKCVLTSFPEQGTAEEDYQTFSVEAAALPRLSDNKWMTTALRETTAALP